MIDLARKIPLVPAVLAASLAWFFGPQHATNEFYVVAAEIIPLLLLAVALEARLLSVRFPNIAALTTEIRDLRRSLERIAAEVDDLSNSSPDLAAEWREKVTDQREQLAGQFERLQKARPGMRRYQIIVRLYAGLTVVVLLVGELSALTAVAEGTYKHAVAKWAFGAIVLGLVAVLIAALRHAPNES
jgi:hypothetical protein